MLTLAPNTLVVVAAGASATKSAGVLIKTFGAACAGHMDQERYEFCWIVDFPMYEIGDESGELEFSARNPGFWSSATTPSPCPAAGWRCC